MSDALDQFEYNFETVAALRDMREAEVRFTHPERLALNQSGMIFIVTAWEAYVEDIVREAAAHLAEHTASFGDLPTASQRNVIKMLASDAHELAAARLAGDGWRQELINLAEARTSGNAFNTPKPERVSDLLAAVLGLDNIESHWKWAKMSSASACARLTETIEIRGAIVHAGEEHHGLNKMWLKTYGNHVSRLVKKTVGEIRRHCVDVSGHPLD